MRASLKKKRDFLSKLAEGRKLSNPGETQWQREIKKGMGVVVGQNKRQDRKEKVDIGEDR